MTEKIQDTMTTKTTRQFIMIALFVFAYYLFTRLWMLLNYGAAGMGYDIGIYHYQIQKYFEQIGQSVVPFGFSNFSNMLMLLGDSAEIIMFVWYVALSVLIFVLLYLVVRNYFASKQAAIWALILFSISITQFEFFWWYYYRNFLAVALFLLFLLLYHYRSYLIILPLAAIGIIHPLSLAPIGLGMLIYCFLVDRSERIFILASGFVSALLVLVFNSNEVLIYLQELWHYHGLTANFILAGRPNMSGEFVTIPMWLGLSILYAPFGVYGIWIFRKSQKMFVCLFLSNLVLIFLGFALSKRFIIFVDLILIIFSAPVWYAIAQKIKKYDWAHLLLLLFFLITSAFSLFLVVLKLPMIQPFDLAVIKNIPNYAVDSEYIFTDSSHYAPWLQGYSGKKVIAPGMFDNDKWSRGQWLEFAKSSSAQQCEMLKSLHISPLYVFSGHINHVTGDCFIKLNNYLLKAGI